MGEKMTWSLCRKIDAAADAFINDDETRSWLMPSHCLENLPNLEDAFKSIASLDISDNLESGGGSSDASNASLFLLSPCRVSNGVVMGVVSGPSLFLFDKGISDSTVVCDRFLLDTRDNSFMRVTRLRSGHVVTFLAIPHENAMSKHFILTEPGQDHEDGLSTVRLRVAMEDKRICPFCSRRGITCECPQPLRARLGDFSFDQQLATWGDARNRVLDSFLRLRSGSFQTTVEVEASAAANLQRTHFSLEQNCVARCSADLLRKRRLFHDSGIARALEYVDKQIRTAQEGSASDPTSTIGDETDDEPQASTEHRIRPV